MRHPFTLLFLCATPFTLLSLCATPSLCVAIMFVNASTQFTTCARRRRTLITHAIPFVSACLYLLLLLFCVTVYDMCKAASHRIRIVDTRLLRKSGGKSSDVNNE
jgi:molybdenum cofactor biosynthesis enzyme